MIIRNRCPKCGGKLIKAESYLYYTEKCEKCDHYLHIKKCLVCGTKIPNPRKVAGIESSVCLGCANNLEVLGIAIKKTLTPHFRNGDIAPCFYCGEKKDTFEANTIDKWHPILVCKDCIMKARSIVELEEALKK